MRPWMCLPLLTLALLVGCGSGRISDRSLLTWRVANTGPECFADITRAQPNNGKGSLEMVARSLPGDDAGMNSLVKVNVQRLDGAPLCTLGELTDPGSHFLLDMMRDPRSGDGLPDYIMPYVSLMIQTADKRRVELIWETAYNGYHPGVGVFPEGKWMTNIAINDGTFWMRVNQNFNVADGFQPLTAWRDGHVTTWKQASTPPLNADTRIVAIELGFGNGVPGYMRAYLDNLRLSVPGKSYTLNFEPMEKPRP